MATIAIRRSVSSFGPLQHASCALAGVTALVHLGLAAMTVNMIATQPALVASMGGATALAVMAVLFACNFGGYVVLATALYLPSLRRFQTISRRSLIAFTAVTILAYFAMAVGHYDAFGFADKATELLLIALLLVDGRQSR